MTDVSALSGPVLIGGPGEAIVGLGQEPRRGDGTNRVRLNFVQRRASIPAFLGHVPYLRQLWAAETRKDHERSLHAQEGAAQLSRADAHNRGAAEFPFADLGLGGFDGLTEKLLNLPELSETPEP